MICLAMDDLIEQVGFSYGWCPCQADSIVRYQFSSICAWSEEITIGMLEKLSLPMRKLLPFCLEVSNSQVLL